MDSLPTVPTASNAAPAQPPVRRKASNRTRDRHQAAYAACREHPAYRDAALIADKLDDLQALCVKFVRLYGPDTINDHLEAISLECDSLGGDFEFVHENLKGAAWFLDVLCNSLTTSLVPQIDTGDTAVAVEGGAA